VPRLERDAAGPLRPLPFCCHAPRSALRQVAPYTKKPAVSSGSPGWSVPGSNRRPPACKVRET
jgi:hypothetical protein